MLHSNGSSFEPAHNSQEARYPNDARAESIAVICHELRNSLAVVRNVARLLPAPPEGGGSRSARALIERQVQQMSRHIDELLPQHHVDARHGLQLSLVDLRVSGRNAIDAIAPEMMRRGHNLAVTLPDEPAWARADGGRIEQALSNLLINAAKYTPDGGDITLTMESDHDLVRVCVRDSGVGIEPAMLTRIFGMFVRVGEAQPWAEKGSGIGLAVVKNIVELHGGTAKATSPGLGLGSEFTISLPALRD